MDLLDLDYLDIEKLNLDVEDNRCGWLKLLWRYENKKLEYEVSYICEPWENLIGSFLKLCLKEKPSFLEEDRISKESAIYKEHDLEGDIIMFLFYRDKDKIVFLIMNNVYDDEIDDLIWAKFNAEEYKRQNFYEEPKGIKNRVEFAFRCDIKQLAIFFKKVIDIIEKERINTNSDKDMWGYYYPSYYIDKLDEIIIEN